MVPAPPEDIEVDDANGKKVKVENSAYVTWLTRDQQVLRYLLNVVSPDILPHVLGLDTAADVWKALEGLTNTQSRSRTTASFCPERHKER